MKTSKPVVALALIALLGTGVGCARVRSKAAMKDGNKDYKEENFKKAVDDYERATRLDPNFSEAWFYLGSSHQAQYRPGKESPENKKQLEDAIAAFTKSLETNPGQTESQKNEAQHPGRAHRYLRGRPLQELRRSPEVRAAARGRQPERLQEPLRSGQPLREVQQGPEAEGSTRRWRSRTRGRRACGAWPLSTTSRIGTRRESPDRRSDGGVRSSIRPSAC